jgi:hypothetical protein
MRDKRLYKLAASVFEGWRAAEVSRIGFNLDGIKVVLAD